jgi:CSLREA domain-containing protein
MGRKFFILILFVLLLLTIPVRANSNSVLQFANTGGYRVTVTTDSNDGTCDSHCSLREAIIAANADTSLNPIVYIPNGTYILTLTGADEDAAATGDLDITRPMNIIGEGRDTTIIDANDIDRAFDVHGTGLTAIDEGTTSETWNDAQFLLSDVTIQNGFINSGANGGGIRIASTAPSVPRIALVDVTIINSRANSGGGIATQDIHFQSIRLRLLNNIASNHGGGAYYNALASTPSTITESGLLTNGNSAQLGGGIYHTGDSQPNSDFYLLPSGAIVNNSAVDGGGLYLDGSYYAELYGTFSGNIATNNGGGFYSHNSSARFAFSTITNNTADADDNGSGDGGAIYVVEPNANGHSISESIVYSNMDKGGEAPECAAIDFTIPIQYSVLASFAPCIIGDPGIDGGNVFADPRLLPLDDYGGQTLTHALQADSPAIGLASVEFSDFCYFNYDQRGIWRSVFHACDAGAYAYLGGLPITSIPPVPYIYDYNSNSGASFNRFPRDTVANSAREYPLHISFTERLINIPNSTTHPAEIDNPENYRLVLPGDDDVFQTNSCAAILNDDLSAEFSVAEEEDTLGEIFESDIQIIPITDGTFAQNLYRLIICDEITDLDGNALDGNRDGTSGGDAYFNIDFAPGPNFSDLYLYVTTTADTTDNNCNSHCSLRDAIRTASFNTHVQSYIILPAGTYNLTLTGANENNGFTGDLDVKSRTVVIGAGVDSTIIDGQGRERIFDASSNLLELRHLTVRNGIITNGVGGAIYNSGIVKLEHTRLINNSANLAGGAIYAGTVESYASEFINNRVTEGYGGAITALSALLHDSTFIGNNAYGWGSAVSSYELELYNNTFSGNIGDEGVIHYSDQIYAAHNTIADNDSGVVFHSYMDGSSARVEFYSSIFSNNGNENCAIHPDSINFSPPEIFGRFNVLDDSSCSFGERNLYNTDALLLPLSYNGGATQTHALVENSPAHHVLRYPQCDALFDQHGTPRNIDGLCDIGSFEGLGTIINAPTNLSVTAPTATEIFMLWADNADNETNYLIERSLDSSNWVQVATRPANSIAYSDIDLDCGTPYWYRIRATDGTSYSFYSNTISGSTDTCLQAGPVFTVTYSGTPGDGCRVDYCSLEAAMEVANADEGESIVLPAGNYDVPVYLSHSIHIIGAGAGQTIFNGNGSSILFSLADGAPEGISLTLDGVTLQGGYADGGTAVFPDPEGIFGSITVRNSHILDNVGDATIFYSPSGDEIALTFENVNISNNVSEQNALILLTGASSPMRQLVIRDSLITGNSTTATYSTSFAKILTSGFELVIERSAFVRHGHATSGSVLEITGASTTAIQISNSTFSENKSGSTNYPSVADISGAVNLILMHNTITQNEGIPFDYNPGTTRSMTLFGNIIAGNDASNDFRCRNVQSQGYNILGNMGCTYTSHATDIQTTEPELSTLTADGATWVHRPLIGSPALDTIPAASCTLTTDQRGISRPQSIGCDIGAVEGFTLSLTAPTNLQFTDVIPFVYNATSGLVWDDNSSDESSFEIQRSADDGANWQVVGTTQANVSAYTDDGLGCATSSYRVRAYRAADGMYSPYSNVIERENFCTAITVTVLNDVSDGICTPVADCSLREAVALTGISGTPVIQLPAGNYTLTSPLSISYSLTIQGAGREQTFIDMGGLTHFSNIDFLGTDTSITVEGITFLNGNTTPFNGRAVIFSQGIGSDFGTLRLRNSAVLNSSGRTIFAEIRQFGLYYVEHSHFEDNVSQSGVILTSRSGADINSQYQNVRIYISDSVFSRNDVSGTGGNILSINSHSMLVWIERSAFVNNGLVALRGSIIVWNGADGRLSMANSTFSGNSGGFTSPTILDIPASRLMLFIDHVTMINDYPDAQHAWDIATPVQGAPTLEITNSILASTNGQDFAECSGYPVEVFGGGNILQNFGTDCQWSWMGSNFDDSPGLPVVDFAADNGGNTLTHAVYPGSLAHDASECSPSVDQRGYPRPYGAGCDIGAYELGEGTSTAPVLQLTASDVISVSLGWADITDDEGYEIQRSDDAGTSWQIIDHIQPDSTAYTASNLTCGTTYYYRVRGFNGVGYSLYSNIVSATTDACTLIPPTLSVSSTTYNSVSLAWTNPNGSGLEYWLERAPLNENTWTALLPAYGTTSTDSPLVCETSYRYRLRAYNGATPEVSQYSNIVTALTAACLQTSPFTVTTTTDGNDGACDVLHCTLREAVIAANNTFNPTINIPAGAYTLTLTGALEDNAATGDLDIQGSMTIQGADAATTIIDGNGTDRIFDVFNALNLTIQDLTIQNGYGGNSYEEAYFGGGILLQSGYNRLNIQFTDLVVQNNSTALSGGGIAAYGSATFTRVRVLNNTSDTGGGLLLRNGTFEIVQSEFRGNSAESGGGLGLDGNQSSLHISQSLFANNTAYYGGGIVAFGIDGVVHISNTTFSNNLAYGFGGAYLADSVFTEFEYVTFTNNVSTANSEGDGGGSAIAYSSDEATAPALNFFATVIYGNTDGGGKTAQCIDISVNGDIITTEGYNLFGDMSGCSLTEAVAGAGATDIYGQSPLLLALADNGGFTQTHALASNSPAVNAIPAGNCTLMTDQRGITRPDGAACDIGAYEGAVAIPTVPVPTNLTATAASYQAINLSWLDNASDETNYRVERSLNGTDWTEITTLAANAVAHSDSGLTCDTTYWYRVRAYRAADTLYSAYSNIVSATTAPCAPVLSLGTVGQTSVQLTWTDGVTETQYRLERSPDGTNNWSEITQPVQNATSYTDSSVVCEGHYVYRIRAYRSSDNLYSQYSTSISVDTLLCALTAPTGLSATASMDTAIMLQWSESNNSDTAHLLERRDDGINWVQIAALAPNSTAYSNTGLTCETSYEYRVRVYRSIDNAYSGFSNIINPMTALCPTPKTPRALQSTAIQARSVDLAWLDHNFGVMRYTVERSDNGGTSWQSYPALANDVTTFNAYNLLCQHNYLFRVRGLRVVDSLLTDYSTTINAQTAACPALVTPNAPTVTSFDRTFVALAFTADGTGEVDNWQLERLTTGNWQLIATLPVNTTQYTDNNLTCATSYSYRLSSYRAEDSALSAPSTETPVTTASCPAIIQSTVGLYKNGLWMFTAVNASGVPDVMFNFGPTEAGWTPLVGDWDGDGVDGIGIYRNGLFILRNSSNAGTTDASFYFGAREAGWQPIVGDWNGDGVDTIGVYKAGLVMLTNNHPAQTVDYRFRIGDGTAGWLILAGDWDNNGADSIGLYRNGEFYLTNNLDGTGLRRPFRFGPASSDWTPLTGDWNADGTDTIGIYRQSVWRLRDTNSTGGVDTGFNFGAREAGWIPLASYRGGTVALAMLAQSAVDAPVLTIPTETEVAITPAPETVTAEPVTPTVELVTPEATAEVTEPVVEVTATTAPTESATPEPTPVPTEAPLEATESTPVTEVSSEQTPEVTETVGE